MVTCNEVCNALMVEAAGKFSTGSGGLGRIHSAAPDIDPVHIDDGTAFGFTKLIGLPNRSNIMNVRLRHL